MNRAVIVDASKVTAAEFVRALRPQPSRLELLCEELWVAAGNSDRERIREIHAEIALTKAVEADLRFTMDMQRKDAA